MFQEVMGSNLGDHLKHTVLCIIQNFMRHYGTLQKLGTFGFLCKYLATHQEETREQMNTFHERYNIDVSEDILEEMQHLKITHTVNLHLHFN
jgi:hypothetical protein